MTLFGSEINLQSDFEKKCELIFKFYNRYAKKNNLQRVIKLTTVRKRDMEELASLPNKDLKEFLRQSKLSIPFFKQFNGFCFDWIIQKHNYIKVLEGKYTSTKKNNIQQSNSIRSANAVEKKEF